MKNKIKWFILGALTSAIVCWATGAFAAGDVELQGMASFNDNWARGGQEQYTYRGELQLQNQVDFLTFIGLQTLYSIDVEYGAHDGKNEDRNPFLNRGRLAVSLGRALGDSTSNSFVLARVRGTTGIDNVFKADGTQVVEPFDPYTLDSDFAYQVQNDNGFNELGFRYRRTVSDYPVFTGESSPRNDYGILLSSTSVLPTWWENLTLNRSLELFYPVDEDFADSVVEGEMDFEYALVKYLSLDLDLRVRYDRLETEQVQALTLLTAGIDLGW